MRRVKTLFGFILIIVAALPGCGSDPDIEAIRTGIRDMSVAAENKDADGIIRYLDEDYQGAGGARSGVADLLQNHFLYNKEINLIISDIEIELADDRRTATTSIRLLMTGGEGRIPERGRLSAIRAQWAKRNDEWKVSSAEWKPVLLQLRQ